MFKGSLVLCGDNDRCAPTSGDGYSSASCLDVAEIVLFLNKIIPSIAEAKALSHLSAFPSHLPMFCGKQDIIGQGQ